MLNLKYLTALLLLTLMLPIASTATAADQPNILWLTCEDNNINWIGCYGNPYADTPNIDKLATEGFQYMHCYANAPVCAPSRSTWITGIHAVSMGTQPMRSRYEIPHDRIQYYPDLMKDAGYYVSNNGKTDYNIGGRDDTSPWDSRKTDWALLKQKQPFFQIINSTKSHESKAFGDVNNTTHSPGEVRLAKYHPDIPDIRKNYAHYHDQIKKMDADIGLALQQLEEAGLAENTIVIHNSDHGGVIARSKRFLFNSGTHCPLIIRIPEKYKHLRPGKPGTKIHDIVSFIDMTKTWLNITGSKTPDYLQGKVFLGPDKENRNYHVSFRGRMDERCDNVRAIRDKKDLLYIRNYMPYAPWGQELNYLWKMVATQAWEQHHEAGKTDAVTGRFFGTKPMTELYDAGADPDNVNNLIDDPQYASDIKRLSTKLDEWQVKNYDAGLLPESEVVELAAANNLTIYDLVRNPSLYNIKALQKASNLAIEQDPANLSKLYKNLTNSNAGVRYWGVVGLFNLQDHAKIDLGKIRPLLKDSSDHVQAMVAWILYNNGDKSSARKKWIGLLEKSSYASLKVFNIIDWIKEDPTPYLPAMRGCKYEHQGYIARMQEYFGVLDPKKKPRT